MNSGTPKPIQKSRWRRNVGSQCPGSGSWTMCCGTSMRAKDRRSLSTHWRRNATTRQWQKTNKAKRKPIHHASGPTQACQGMASPLGRPR